MTPFAPVKLNAHAVCSGMTLYRVWINRTPPKFARGILYCEPFYPAEAFTLVVVLGGRCQYGFFRAPQSARSLPSSKSSFHHRSDDSLGTKRWSHSTHALLLELSALVTSAHPSRYSCTVPGLLCQVALMRLEKKVERSSPNFCCFACGSSSPRPSVLRWLVRLSIELRRALNTSCAKLSTTPGMQECTQSSLRGASRRKASSRGIHRFSPSNVFASMCGVLLTRVAFADESVASQPGQDFEPNEANVELGLGLEGDPS